jgi:hypothetical protein
MSGAIVSLEWQAVNDIRHVNNHLSSDCALVNFTGCTRRLHLSPFVLQIGMQLINRLGRSRRRHYPSHDEVVSIPTSSAKLSIVRAYRESVKRKRGWAARLNIPAGLQACPFFVDHRRPA